MSTAEEKFAKELKVVENIAFNFVLPDAQADASGLKQKNADIGFGKQDSGTITFTIDADLASDQAEQYRTSAEAHATHFADAFNQSLVTKTPQGNVPLLSKDIVSVDGNVVHFDLAGLRKLLSEHTIADQLPQISKQYSIQYQVETATKQAPYIVESDIQQRKAEREVLKACNEELDNPGHLQKLAERNPQLAAMAQGVLQQAAAISAEAEKDPALLDQVRENNSQAFVDIIEKVAEKSKEKKTAPDADLAGKESSGKFSQQVEERRAQAEGQAQQR